MEIQSAKQRMVKDITEKDIDIQVTGYVKEIIDENAFLLDDTTGVVNVNLVDLDVNVKIGDLINVIGKFDMKMGGETMILAEIIQDMNNLNFEYYKKLYELKKTLP